MDTPLEPPSPSLPSPGWHDDPNDPTSLRYWDGSQWTDQRAPKVPAPATTQLVDRKDWPPLRMLALVSAIGVVVGSFGPWVTASAFVFTVTANGMDGDGKFTAAAGAIIAVLIFTRKYLAATIIATLNGAIAIYEWWDLDRNVSDLNNNVDAAGVASIGWGLYLVLGAAVAAFITTVLLVQEDRRAKKKTAATV